MPPIPTKLAASTGGGDSAVGNSAARLVVCSGLAVQEGGQPSPFDRIRATRRPAAGVEHRSTEPHDDPASTMVGMRDGKIVFIPLGALPDLVDGRVQWPRAARRWMAHRPLADIMASVQQ